MPRVVGKVDGEMRDAAMSALQRRKSDAPDRRPTGVPSTPQDPGASAFTLDGPFAPVRSGYWQTWEDVPPAVREALKGARCLPSVELVGGARPPEPPEHDGDQIEHAQAWAVGEDSWTSIDARRARTLRDGAAQPWDLTVRRYPYVGEIKHRSGTVPVDAGSVAAGDATRDIDGEQPSVLDVLPSAVRAQLLDTIPAPAYEDRFLIQEAHKRRPYEHRAGIIRVASRQLVAVLATRRIEQRRWGSVRDAERSLASTPWYVRALTAGFGPEQVVELRVGDVDVALGPGGAVALPPAGPDTGRSG